MSNDQPLSLPKNKILIPVLLCCDTQVYTIPFKVLVVGAAREEETREKGPFVVCYF